MKVWRTLKYLLITTLAIAAMGFAVTVTYTPELLPPDIRVRLQTVTEQIDDPTFLLVLGVMGTLGGIIGLWIWRSKGLKSKFFDPEGEESNRDVPVAGYDIAVEVGEEDWTESVAGPTPKSVKDSLRDVLLEVYRPDFDGQSAVEVYLDRGEWTNDRYAAAFLSMSQDIDYPLHHRISAWLYPERARDIRVRRSLRAVESVADERFSLYERLDHQPSGIERVKALLRKSRMGDRE